MNRAILQTAWCCLLALTFVAVGVSHKSTAQAQVVVTQGECPAAGTPCTVVRREEGNSPQVAPPFGPAQIGIAVSAGGFVTQDEAEIVKNQPYQAQAVTEIRQTLADGSHIVQTTTATVARDSKGRTVRTQKINAIGPWRGPAGDGNNPEVTMIFDPVKGIHIDYTSDPKVAHILPMPRIPAGPIPSPAVIGEGVSVAAPGGPNGPVGGYFVQGHTITSGPGEEKNDKSESLGTKTIEGIEAVGKRITTTIPAGTIGNDKDLVITHETWYSPDLKLVILSSQNDPRFGETTYSLTNIQRGEPDLTLFQVPSGYKIYKVRDGGLTTAAPDENGH